MGKPLVRFCEGQEYNCGMEEILWHRRESRRQQRKQTSSFSRGSLLSTRKYWSNGKDLESQAIGLLVKELHVNRCPERNDLGVIYPGYRLKAVRFMITAKSLLSISCL